MRATVSPEKGRRVWLAPAAVWAGLVALVLVNLGVAYLPLAASKTALHLSISVAMVAVVAFAFMRLGRVSNLVRMAALAGVLWASFLFVLAGVDILARS